MRLGFGFGFSLNNTAAPTFANISGKVLDLDFMTAANLRNGSDVAPANGEVIKTAVNLVSGSTSCTQGTNGNRPIWTLGSPSYAAFTAASSHYLRTTEASVVNAFKDGHALTLFVVNRPAAVSGVKVWAAGDAIAARPYRLFFANSSSFAYEARDDALGSDQLLNAAASTVTVADHVYEYADSGSSITLANNGTVDQTDTSYTQTTPATLTGVSIGTWGNATGSNSPFDGRMYRVVAYSRKLTAQERAAVRTYLGALVGLTI